MKNNPAVKSMLQMAFYLVVLIGMWLVIGIVMYPDAGKNEDAYAAYVEQNQGVLVQLAENAIDPAQYPGITTAAEVQKLLAEQEISEIIADEYGAAFILPSAQLEISRAIVYRADGEYVLPSELAGWTQMESDTASLRWTGGLAGKGYVIARPLAECFFYQEIYNPT